MNPKQQEAVEYNKGPLLLIAGAGTGKTSTIIHKIKHLVDKKLARPDEVLALTFTEKAAQEMQDRVDEMMPYGLAHMQISTFHSFADQVLRAEAHHIGLSPAFRLMTEAESVVFLKSQLFSLDLSYFRPLGNPGKFVWALLKHFSRIQDEDISPEEYIRWAKKNKESAEHAPELARAYRSYLALKVRNNLFDYSDLMYYLLRLLRKRSGVLKEYRARYRYVLVDEFQDTNIAQYALIKLLCPPGRAPKLTVVGDDSQAIYKFRGASVSNILTFMKDYKKARQITLLTNYRSTQSILDSAYRLIRHNDPDTLESQLGISKQLVSVQDASGDDVVYILADNAYDEAGEVVRRIKTLAETYAYSDIAILVRAHNHSEPFARSLALAGIPYQFHGASALYKQPHVKDLIAYIRFLADTGDSVSLYRVMNMDILGIDAGEVHKILMFCKKFNLTLYEGLSVIVAIRKGEQTEAEHAYETHVPHLTDDTHAKIDTLHAMISRHIARIKKASAGQILYYFLEDTGYLRTLSTFKTEQEETVAQNISRFFDRLKQYEMSHEDSSVFAVADFLTMSLELGESPAVEKTDLEEFNAVHILTVHAAKGLEFPIVFIVNLVEGRFPSRDRRETIPVPQELIKEMLPTGNHHELEERRLFYVAMTRAKARLFLTGAKYYGEGKRLLKISKFVQEAIGETVFKGNLAIKSEERSQLSMFDFKPAEPQPVGKIPRTTLNLSYSQIDRYKTCPLSYKYEYELRLPKGDSASASFGTTVHSALQRFYEEFRTKKSIGLRRLLALYEESWIPLGYVSRAHEMKRRREGKTMLTDYYENYHTKRIKILDLEKKFKIRISPAVTVTGSIDRVDVNGAKGINIIDYKSGKKPDDKKLKQNIQLTIYLMAASDAGVYGKKIEEVNLTYYYLADSSTVSVNRIQEDILKAKEAIVETADKIMNREFTPKVGPWCDTCAFRMICEAWQ